MKSIRSFLNRALAPFALTAALIVGAAPMAAANAAVGFVMQVQPDSFQRLNASGFALRNASRIFQNHTVYTLRFGSAEIRLNDGSELLISPNSEILIDDFIYFEDTSTGRFAMSLLAGALRVSSGRMASPSYTVNTTVAFIGVRGTLYWLDVDEPGILKIWVDEGVVEARPVQSDEVFVFTAPVYAECTPTTCASTDAPPPPEKFPDDPRRR